MWQTVLSVALDGSIYFSFDRDLARIVAYRRDAIAAIFAAPTAEARRRAS
jgi:hypothetical protein